MSEIEAIWWLWLVAHSPLLLVALLQALADTTP